MNKFGIVLGVAAVATLAGCKDPDYAHNGASNTQNDVKTVNTTPIAEEKPIVIESATPHCKCKPGTKHTSPCTCGAPDCMCIVEAKPIITADLSAKPAETTTYIVQNGDYLAKISKKFNVTISSIKRANNLKSDTIRIGQKLQIPGKVDVGVQTVPANAYAKTSKSSKKSAAALTGATKEYVVKSGDTLGAIAYGNGCNIRQLKELNGLTGNSIRVGQKLKVPAGKATAVSAAKPVVTKATPAVTKKDETKKETPAVPQETAKPVDGGAAAPVVPDAGTNAAAAGNAEPKAEGTPAVEPKPEAPAAAATRTYIVQEGEDMTGISIRWGVSAAAIRELNNLSEDAQLTTGQIIKLPADAQQ